MRFVLEIECDNDAFQPNVEPEIARLLREAAASVEAFRVAVGDNSQRLRDVNGNTVGTYRLEAE